MNVLVLSEMFPDSRNPTLGIFVLEQMRALRRQEVKLSVIAPRPWIPKPFRRARRVQKYLAIPSRSCVDGFPVEYPRVPMFPGGALLYLAGFVHYLWCRRLLKTMLRDPGIDLIHAHAILPIGFAAMLLGREFKIPVICTLHGSDVNVAPWRNWANKRATKWALTKVDRLFAVSQALAEKVRELGRHREINFVPNGADGTLFRAVAKQEARSRLGLPAAEKILLFVGNLIPVKNVPLLLQAFAQISIKDSRLCLVGDGKLKQTLKETAASMGILERCHFAGERPHEEIPLWMSAADCLVISSLSEGFPTVIPEAMLCRLPVLGTAVGGIPEALAGGTYGLLVKSGDVSALAEAITTVITNSELSAGLADRAESFANKNLTWESNAREVVLAYRDSLMSYRNSLTTSRAFSA